MPEDRVRRSCHPTVTRTTSRPARETAGVPESFATRFEQARADLGPLVWGLDPSGHLLEQWGLGDTATGLDRFVDIVLPVAATTVGLVKPQSAFYERHGWRGVRTLARLVVEARSAGLLVIIDAKRGDIGSTNDAYGDAYLGTGAPMAADALTVTPYLGLGAMGGLASRANQAGCCLIVVVRSSNPEGRAVQGARGASGRTVDQQLLHEIGDLNKQLCPDGIGPVGAVVAPGDLQPGLDLPSANALFLAPGIGAQGATMDDVARTFATCVDRVMPSVSRGILAGGPDPARLHDAAATTAGEARRLLAG